MTTNDEELYGRLDAATAAVTGARGDLQRQIDTSKMAIALAISVAIIGGLVNFVLVLKVWQQADDLEALQRDKAVEDCERGNASRTAIVDAFNQYTEALIAASGPSTDPARQARVDGFRADLARRLAPLAPRDCTQAVNPAAETS